MQKTQKTWVISLGQEGLLEEDIATYSSILARKTPWTEEPNRLWSMGSHRVRHDWNDWIHTHGHKDVSVCLKPDAQPLSPSALPLSPILALVISRGIALTHLVQTVSILKCQPQAFPILWPESSAGSHSTHTHTHPHGQLECNNAGKASLNGGWDRKASASCCTLRRTALSSSPPPQKDGALGPPAVTISATHPRLSFSSLPEWTLPQVFPPNNHRHTNPFFGALLSSMSQVKIQTNWRMI